MAHNQNQEKNPKQRKGKIQTKQKTLNEPISLSNRFSLMDIDPVETITEDSDEADSINLQKRLHEKINIKDNPTENETTNPTQKMLHKLQKVDIDQLQDQRKKEKIKNQLQIPL